MLTQIASAIAEEEDVTAAQVKGEMLQQISLCLARSAAKAVARRKSRVYTGMGSSTRRAIMEAQMLQPCEDIVEIS